MSNHTTENPEGQDRPVRGDGGGGPPGVRGDACAERGRPASAGRTPGGPPGPDFHIEHGHILPGPRRLPGGPPVPDLPAAPSIGQPGDSSSILGNLALRLPEGGSGRPGAPAPLSRPPEGAASPRVSRWKELRAYYKEITSALEVAGIESKMVKCGLRFGQCRCKVHRRNHKCGSRLCPFDARRLAATLTDIYIGLAKRCKDPRFLTLTGPLIPYDGDLLAGVKRRRKALERLRHSKVFALVDAGIYAIEVVLRRGGFHLHFHLLIDAAWIENRNELGRPLETRWHGCLVKLGEDLGGGRAVVDIRRADEGAIREVLKYAVKGTARKRKGGAVVAGGAGEASVLDGVGPLLDTGQKIGISDEDEGILSWGEVPAVGLRQLVALMESGIHLVEPFGAWRGVVKDERKRVKDEAREKAEELKHCEACGDLIKWGAPVRWSSPWVVEGPDGLPAYAPPLDVALWQRRGYQAWKDSRKA